MTTNRPLTAIMMADVVGYLRLMEMDEAGTLAALKNGERLSDELSSDREEIRCKSLQSMKLTGVNEASLRPRLAAIASNVVSEVRLVAMIAHLARSVCERQAYPSE